MTSHVSELFPLLHSGLLTDEIFTQISSSLYYRLVFVKGVCRRKTKSL